MFLHRADRLIDVARADSCNNAAMLAHDVGDPFGDLRDAVAQADDQIPASCSSASRTPHDPDKARALLAEAGYADGVQLQYYSNADQSSQQRAEIIMEQLRQVGINCVLTTGSNSDMFQRFMVRGEGDAIMVNWTGRPDPVQCFLFVYGEQGANNPGKVPPPPEMAEAVAEAQAAVSQEDRKPAFSRIEQAALEHALSCEVAFVPAIEVHSPKVGGYQPSLLGKPKFNRLYLES